ncbi:MAG: tetratricopeptide repeat protein [Chthoniobacter sp.]|nr:tetratricopeptide repeat protein [Chthoniobacter sp.]
MPPSLPAAGPCLKTPGRCATAILALAVFVAFGRPTARAEDDPALEQYFVANAAYNRNLYPVAIPQFEGFLAKNPNHPKADMARRGLGLSLYALKQYDKALPHFAALLAKPDLAPEIERERIIMLQGQCLLHSSKAEDARKLFIENWEKLADPKFKTAALAAICDVAFGKAEWDKVIEWTEKLLATAPSPDQAGRGLYQRGFAFFKTNQLAEAAATLEKVAATEAAPTWKTRAAYLQGECHSSLGQQDKAEPAFAAALPGMTGAEAAECQYRLGVTRFLLAKYEPAAADFAAYVKDAKPDEKGKPAAYLGEAKLYIARCLFEREDKKAEQQFAALAAGDDLVAAKANLWWARVFSRNKDNFDRAADILAPAVERLKASPVIDDLDFDYANAEMSRKVPDWKKAAAALQRVEARGRFGQMAEVLGQRATCLHKLQDFGGSMQLNDVLLQRFAQNPLAGDARFMRAENLFLLNRAEDATKAYTEFLAAHKDHPSTLAAEFRLAQIHHLAGRWDESLASARPLLAKKPEGRLFAQLSFVVGDCLFRQEKWAEAIPPLEDFVGARVDMGTPVEIGKSGKPKNRKKRTVTLAPNLDTALLELAVACDKTNQKEKAIEYLTTLTGDYGAPTPHLPLALAEQGRLAYEAKDLPLARAALERFLAEDTAAKEPFKAGAAAQMPRVMYYLGWVDASEGKHVPAGERFAKVPRNHPLGADAALQEGIALVNAANFKEAAKHFTQMLNQFREHEKLALVVYYAGLSDARLEQWGPAATHFKKYVDAYPNSDFADQALYEWAWCERSLKRNKEAVALYDQLLAKHPQSPLTVKVQSELAELNLDSGAQEKVIAQLTETLKATTDETLREPLRIQLASAHFKMGDHQTAVGLFETLLMDYPKSKLRASMLFQAGESRLKLKETVAARDHFANAAKMPGTEETLAESIVMRLAETQSFTDLHKEAAQTYRQFLSRFPKSQWTRNAIFGLGYALERGDKPNEAIAEYSKLLADPKLMDLWTVRGRFQTGECYFNMRKYEQAVAEFVNLELNYKKYPDWQAKAALEIGRVLLTQGKRDEATQSFKDVISRYSKENAAVVARQYLDEIRSKQ